MGLQSERKMNEVLVYKTVRAWHYLPHPPLETEHCIVRPPGTPPPRLMRGGREMETMRTHLYSEWAPVRVLCGVRRRSMVSITPVGLYSHIMHDMSTMHKCTHGCTGQQQMQKQQRISGHTGQYGSGDRVHCATSNPLKHTPKPPCHQRVQVQYASNTICTTNV